MFDRLYKNKWIYTVLFLFTVSCCIYYTNFLYASRDEFFWSIIAESGFKSFIEYFGSSYVSIGRPLANFQLIWMWITCAYGPVSSAIEIIANIAMFALAAHIIYKLFNNFKFSVLFYVVALGSYQVTFEPTPPVAYNLYIIAMVLFEISLILFIKFLDFGRKKDLIISLILYIIMVPIYEPFVAFILFFVVVSFFKLNDMTFGVQKIKRCLYNMRYYVIYTVVYLCAYLILRIIIPATYSGNQVQLNNIPLFIETLWTWIKGSIPFLYWTTPKAQYLLDVNLNMLQKGDGSIIDISGQSLAIVVILCIMIFSWLILENKNGNVSLEKLSNKHRLIAILWLVMCVVVFNIPTSMIGSFQETVKLSETPLVFTATINTSIIYIFFIIAVIFCLSFFMKYKLAKIIIAILSVISIVTTQGLNIIASENFLKLKESIVDRTDVIQTETVQYMGVNGIFAQDLYNTTGTIGTIKNDWQMILNNQGIPITLLDTAQTGAGYIKYDYYQREFWVANTIETADGKSVSNQLTLLSRKNRYGDTVLMQNVDGSYKTYELANSVEDNGFHTYYIDVGEAPILAHQTRIIEKAY